MTLWFSSSTPLWNQRRQILHFSGTTSCSYLFLSFAYILSITPLTHYTSLNSVNWQGSASALFWFSEYTAWPIMNRERMAVMGAVVGAIVVTSVVLATATRQLPFYTRLAWCILPSPGSGLTCSTTTASGLLSATATAIFPLLSQGFYIKWFLNWIEHVQHLLDVFLLWWLLD